MSTTLPWIALSSGTPGNTSISECEPRLTMHNSLVPDTSRVKRHSDLTGNGLVFTEDFTFIQINFQQTSDPLCCGLTASLMAPATEIAVSDLEAMGLEAAAAGDLDGDGWLDTGDVAAFLQSSQTRTPITRQRKPTLRTRR